MSVPMRVPAEFEQVEAASGRIVAYLTEEDEVTRLPNGTLSSLRFTLYADDESHTIINNRDALNVLNANGGVIEGDGRFVMTLSPADNPILNDALDVERHIARFDWGWGVGKVGRYDLVLVVRNQVRVP